MKTFISTKQTISTAEFFSIIFSVTCCYAKSLYTLIRTYVRDFDWRAKYNHLLEILDDGDNDIMDIKPAKFVLINIVVGLLAVVISFLG